MSSRIVKTSPIEITAETVLGKRTLTVTVATKIAPTASRVHCKVNALRGATRQATAKTAPTM